MIFIAQAFLKKSLSFAASVVINTAVIANIQFGLQVRLESDLYFPHINPHQQKNYHT